MKRKYRPQRVRSARRFYHPKDGGNDDGRYNSAEYRRIRDQILSQRPTCEVRTHCDGDKALCIYHIQPIRRKGDPRLTDRRNMLSSCYACNTAEAHARKRHTPNESG